MCKSLQNWTQFYFTEQKSTQPNKVYSTKQSLLNEWMFTQLTKCLKNWTMFTQRNKSSLNWKKVPVTLLNKGLINWTKVYTIGQTFIYWTKGNPAEQRFNQQNKSLHNWTKVYTIKKKFSQLDKLLNTVTEQKVTLLNKGWINRTKVYTPLQKCTQRTKVYIRKFTELTKVYLAHQMLIKLVKRWNHWTNV